MVLLYLILLYGKDQVAVGLSPINFPNKSSKSPLSIIYPINCHGKLQGKEASVLMALMSLILLLVCNSDID